MTDGDGAPAAPDADALAQLGIHLSQLLLSHPDAVVMPVPRDVVEAARDAVRMMPGQAPAPAKAVAAVPVSGGAAPASGAGKTAL